MSILIEVDDSQRLLARVLPWASSQRWFPSTWPVGDEGGTRWFQSFIYRLPHSQILLARPHPDGPWLQLPLIGHEDGTLSSVFWSDWFSQAKVGVEVVSVRPLGKEQSNTSVGLEVSRQGRRSHWIGKIFRIIFPGENPDVSVPLQLADRGFAALAEIRAHLDLPLPADPQTFTSGVVTDFVANDGTAYDYFVRAATAEENIDKDAFTIGRLLAELHAALPQVEVGAGREALRRRLTEAYEEALLVTDQLPDLQVLLAPVEGIPEVTPLSTIHGDLHLGQILHQTGAASEVDRWVFIDFEGEPLRPLSERNAPDYALRDLAGLLRSVDYAGSGHEEWAARTRAACVEGFRSAGLEHLDPVTNAPLLRALEIEKALYEVKYEALFRPELLPIPLRALNI